MFRKIIIFFYFKNIQWREYSLHNILFHAIQNTKYYANYNLDLESFPILTKKIIKKELDNLKSKDINKRKWFYNTSGGSTGTPVKFIQDMEYVYTQREIAYLQKSFAGYKFGDLLIKLWGNQEEILHGTYNYKSLLFNSVKNVKILNSYKLTSSKILEYLEYLDKHKPKLLLGYVHSLYHIAKYIEKNNIKAPKINAIMCTAGTLYNHQKNTLEKVFNAKVYNRYGSREVGAIAVSTTSDELLVSKGVFLEVLTQNGISKNGTGNLLITSLTNYAMPIIRYNIGDIGELETTNNRQVLKKLLGRDVDMFRTIDGDFVDGEYFSDLFYFMDWVTQYQVIQKKINHIIVRIMTDKENQLDMNYIESGIKKVIGCCIVDFEIVDKIDELSSGKFRYTISELK